MKLLIMQFSLAYCHVIPNILPVHFWNTLNLWRVQSSGVYRCVVRRKQLVRMHTTCFHDGLLCGLFLDPEDGGDMALYP
jgi:hypothetical protein